MTKDSCDEPSRRRGETTATNKRVRFSFPEEINPGLVDDGSFSTDDNICWWNCAELKYFKWRLISAAREAIRNPVWKRKLVKIYHTSASIRFYDRTEKRLFDALQSIKVDPGLLSLWVSDSANHNNSLRGLEKFSRTTSLRKGQRQFLSKSCHLYHQVVFMNQDRLSPEQLRQRCLKVSLRDRIFARILGEADALVVKRQCVMLDAPQQRVCCSCQSVASSNTAEEEPDEEMMIPTRTRVDVRKLPLGMEPMA